MSGHRSRDLSRTVKLWMSANGIVQIAAVMPRGFLPLFSVWTHLDAQDLMVRCCKYDTALAVYFFPTSETPNIEDLERAVLACRTHYDAMEVGR